MREMYLTFYFLFCYSEIRLIIFKRRWGDCIWQQKRKKQRKEKPLEKQRKEKRQKERQHANHHERNKKFHKHPANAGCFSYTV